VLDMPRKISAQWLISWGPLLALISQRYRS
jgi:hypothetical protein